jgi:dipeptidyl aminopeptidase/acylaminoacyl peptidase
MTSDLLSRLQSALGAHYSVERELGRGGMATVYLAQDLKHDREVALKVLRPELTAILGRERFLNEVRLTAKLDHPHILTLIDSGETDGLLWYVLPFIRGESLRQRLQRERQLGVDEALAITKQIAGALDYAHARGVIHRDIKPENILLHEGEAMLTDFGIALAVKEAAGSRLTETGLSLGTPSYMSPEQATGDRALDARSDVYSLGAVLYEMLAGEPPHTGATVQAVIARLMTERPTRLRTIRDTVPEGVDAAVAKALAKFPADRFASAREFAGLLTAVPVGSPSRPRRRVLLWGTMAIAGLAVAALLAFGVSRWRAPAAGVPVKMTSSGDITAAALSPDGTRLARSVRECDSAERCSFALVWQDLGGAGELRIADRLGSVRYIEWSPDARHLVFNGSDSTGRWGAFRVGVLGGAVQFLGCCGVGYLATADTVFLVHRDPVRGWFLRVVTPADGVIHDSIGFGQGASEFDISPSPDGKLLLEFTTSEDSSRLVSIDRHWRRLDSLAVPRQIQSSSVWDPRGDAVFLKTSDSGGTSARLERVSVSSRGKLGIPQAVPGVNVSEVESFSIVGSSRTLLYVQGVEETSVYALTRDRTGSVDFKSRLLRRSTGDLGATLSPDGRFLDLFFRPAQTPRRQLAIVPFEGGAEIPAPLAGGEFVEVSWAWNSSRLFYTVRGTGGKVTLYSIDPRSGRARTVGMGPQRAGWEIVRDDLMAWIDDSAGSIVLADTNGVEVRRLADPDRSERYGSVRGSPDGRSVLTTRWNAGLDSLLFTKIDLKDGHRQRLGAVRAEDYGSTLWAADGTIQVAVLETLGTLALYRLDINGRPPARLASFPSEGGLYITFSRDGRRALKVESRPRGDVWMLRNFDGRRRVD